MKRAFELDQVQLEEYLTRFSGQPVAIEQVTPLGEQTTGAAALKAFGYGRPLSITYRLDGATQRVVLRRVSRNGFGRERESDRVAEVWRDFHTFNLLPRHTNALDMIALTTDDSLESAAHVKELLLLTDYVPGQPYADDLLRIRDEGAGSDQDRSRAQSLAEYLASIHAAKHDDPLLWRRRLRDLIGHGEGIMGLADSYFQAGAPDSQEIFPFTSVEELQTIETMANEWRWRLKPLAHRLSQVHGDFHPFNVLFDEGNNFSVIDRSRGQWGEPADDVSCMSINYLFFSLQRYGRLDGPLAELYTIFWETYLAQSGDDELAAVIAPWFAWRALVLASPQWYPLLAERARRQLLTFARRVMEAPGFEWQAVNDYLA